MKDAIVGTAGLSVQGNAFNGFERVELKHLPVDPVQQDLPRDNQFGALPPFNISRNAKGYLLLGNAIDGQPMVNEMSNTWVTDDDLEMSPVLRLRG